MYVEWYLNFTARHRHRKHINKHLVYCAEEISQRNVEPKCLEKEEFFICLQKFNYEWKEDMGAGESVSYTILTASLSRLWINDARSEKSALQTQQFT